MDVQFYVLFDDMNTLFTPISLDNQGSTVL